jgi:hypothetical protein
MKAKKYFFGYIILIIMIMAACSKQDEFVLSQTVFIEDTYYPGLPIYSEWGYNTFGAYIDRKPFVSTSNDLPAKVIVNTDTLHLILRGEMQNSTVDLRFSVKGYSPSTFSELTILNNTNLDLTNPDISVMLKIDNDAMDLEIIEGHLHIIRAGRLFVDEELTCVITSGRFQFKTFMDGEPITISNGRFDLSIGYENFYNI